MNEVCFEHIYTTKTNNKNHNQKTLPLGDNQHRQVSAPSWVSLLGQVETCCTGRSFRQDFFRDAVITLLFSLRKYTGSDIVLRDWLSQCTPKPCPQIRGHWDIGLAHSLPPSVSHNTRTKCMGRQLANVRQEYELKINVSSYIKHALK